MPPCTRSMTTPSANCRTSRKCTPATSCSAPPPATKRPARQPKTRPRPWIARLAKGEDFAKIANELTEDPSGKTNGGDLGYFAKEQMVPEFANVAFSLDKGKVSAPVKTQFGWHVIKVEDKRTKPKPTFEQVKPQIEQFVVRKAQAELVTKLRAEAKIEKNYKVEEPKKDAPAAPPAGEEVNADRCRSDDFVMAGARTSLVPAISFM